MPQDSRFISKAEVRHYRLQGHDIELEVSPSVFPPSPHGSFFAQNVVVKPGESVLDIGSGSGVLSVMAAKLGGTVWATDTDEDAVVATRANAERNGTTVRAERGEFFDPFSGLKFDVILANLPQEIVPPAHAARLGTKLNRTIDGGPNGNDVLLEFLRRAPTHMRAGSRAYILVDSGTDYATALRVIADNFDARLVGFLTAPTKEFYNEYRDWYAPLREQGIISLVSKDGVFHAHEYLFELKRKTP